MCLRIVSALRPRAIFHLGNLPRVPHIGHPRAALLQRPVLFPPSLMQDLRLQLTRFAPRIARRYTGCLPWSLNLPFAGSLRSPRNSLLPRNAQAQPMERHSPRPPVPMCPFARRHTIWLRFLPVMSAKLPQPGIRPSAGSQAAVPGFVQQTRPRLPRCNATASAARQIQLPG